MAQFNSLVDVAIAHRENIPDQLVYSFLANGETVERQLTFKDIDLSARMIAANLQHSYALKKGDRVILLFCPGLQFLEAFFGCLYAGIIAVPVYPPGSGTTWENYLGIVSDAQAAIILADNTKAKFLQRHFKVTQQQSLAPIVNIDDLDKTCADRYLPPDILGSDIALLQYTSGTTSIPKGVIITHSNVMDNEKCINEQITRDYKVGVSWLPLYHDMGLFGSVLQAMYVGGHCILLPPSSFLIKPYRWLKAISDYRANITGCPNFAFDLCVDAIDDSLLDTLDLSQWKIAASGAEPVQAATLKRFEEKFSRCGFSANSYVPCYGLAESTLLACANKIDPAKPPIIISISKKQLMAGSVEIVSDVADQRTLVSCGKPTKDNIIIVDKDNLAVLPENHVGEIWLRGPSVAQGYWNDKEKTDAAFDFQANGVAGYYRTGDLGFLSNGEIYITGRLKDLIIIHGKNHYPGDIEYTLQRSYDELLSDAGAVFTVDINGVERVIVAQEVSRSALSDLDTEALIAKIKSHVTKAHEIQVHGALLLKPGKIPKTSSGKVKRKAVREAYLAGELQEEALADSKTTTLSNFLNNQSTEQNQVSLTDIEEVTIETIQAGLIEWVASKLDVDTTEIAADTSHSSLGLDSVDVMTLFGDMQKWLGVTIDSESLSVWELETLEDIAGALYKVARDTRQSNPGDNGDEVEGFI